MSAAHDAAMAADKYGAQGYLTKPFDMDAVLEVIGRLATTRRGREGGVPTT
jgi:DNA-binding NtrC family response regulator